MKKKSHPLKLNALRILLFFSFTFIVISSLGCAKHPKGKEKPAPEEETLESSPLPSRGEFNPDFDVDYSPLKEEIIYFAFDSAAIPGSERGKIEKIADWMNQHPQTSILLAGHCDERGTEEYNRGLGERRAIAVREYLVGLGISPEKIHTISYGKDRPIAIGHTEADYARNRRVETGVIRK
ncbi:OmpA family protein [Methylacidiphilum caldifontis]|uniref:OmpA family protein n=1 Tax=Methylacidiphilum caldifontis TaxID=2795386 RepID=UPI001A9097CA|nr:OmpA family protein [Methylacidiphilum caldifontis]QSR88019.1 OmpA family protein [Methylacidiphilum caldifontis]